MEINEILVIAMFFTFIAFLFTGIPVGYVLAGVGVIYGLLGYLADIYLVPERKPREPVFSSAKRGFLL
jgi:TRAP-type mannitol/chloroaromatic compound transport system permease large subunit